MAKCDGKRKKIKLILYDPYRTRERASSSYSVCMTKKQFNKSARDWRTKEFKKNYWGEKDTYSWAKGYIMTYGD